MKISSLIVVLLILALTGRAASAQTTASPTPRPTPPPGPFLDKAPDFSSWTIVMQRVSAGGKVVAGKAPEILVSITKTDQTRHYVVRHRVRKIQDGSQEEVWQQGPYVVTHESMWKTPQLGFETARENTAAADFPDFSWINTDNFVGVQQVEGVPCLVFDAMIAGGTEKTDENRAIGAKAQIHVHACIDLATRLPKTSLNADMASSYTFQTPPKAMLALPPADQEMINTYLRDTAARLRPPQHP